MKKRILSLLLALCMIVGLLPTVAMPHAHAEEEGEETGTEVLSSTVTLWGVEATIDNDDTTEDIPAARYWKNGAKATAVPVDSNENDWNYSFTFVDGVLAFVSQFQLVVTLKCGTQ